MSWPNDARDQTFAPGVQVPSAHLNEVQDVIVDVHYSLRDLQRVFTHRPMGSANWDSLDALSALQPAWYHTATANGPEAYMVASPIPIGATITEMGIKYYNKQTDAKTNGSVSLIRIDPNFTVAIAIPFATALSTQLLSGDSGDPVAGYWNVRSFTGLSYQVSADQMYAIRYWGGSAVCAAHDTAIGGIYVNYSVLDEMP